MGALATPLASYPLSNSNLRISLTDAPSRDLKSVFVNVDHAELFVKKGSNQGRLIVSQNMGLVDLMTLRNGVLLPMQDLNLPTGMEITAIRLVLKGTDNHAIKSDDSRCEMATPSGQQSGIKIHLSQPFMLETGFIYSMVMDFDAAKSVVVQGNGTCLLKPVLKLLQVTRAQQVPVNPPPTPPVDPNIIDPGPVNPTPVTDGNDVNIPAPPANPPVEPTPAPAPAPEPAPAPTDGSNTGFENPPTDGTTQPPVITIEDAFNMP